MIFIRALIAVIVIVIGTMTAHAQSISGQGTWETTLLGRDLNLNAVSATSADAVYLYDITLQVTWLRNANVAGQMDWATATNWAANLVTGSGATAINDWRLPTMADPAATLNCYFTYSGANCGYNPATSSSEMASLFYDTLGNKAWADISGNSPQLGWGLSNVGNFQNMQSSGYWLGTVFAPLPNDHKSWLFGTLNGYQSADSDSLQLYALAVRSGDVLAAVPEPETYAMLLAGLGLIGAVGRRREVRALGFGSLGRNQQ